MNNRLSTTTVHGLDIVGETPIYISVFRLSITDLDGSGRKYEDSVLVAIAAEDESVAYKNAFDLLSYYFGSVYLTYSIDLVCRYTICKVDEGESLDQITPERLEAALRA
jgi:hypothetical protein